LLLLCASGRGMNLDDLMGGGKACPAFRCAKGKEPVPVWPTRFKSTGCSGIGGGMVMSMTNEDDGPLLERCCDLRHACFQVCGTSKKACENQFKKCTEAACEKEPLTPAKVAGGEPGNCSSTASLKVMMASLGGCKDFSAGQTSGCSCKKAESVAKERKSWLGKFFKKFSGKAGNLDKLMGKFGENKKNFAQLVMRLADKYRGKVVKKVEDPQKLQMERMMKNFAKDDEEKKKKEEAKADKADKASTVEEVTLDDEDDDKDL